MAFINQPQQSPEVATIVDAAVLEAARKYIQAYVAWKAQSTLGGPVAQDPQMQDFVKEECARVRIPDPFVPEFTRMVSLKTQELLAGMTVSSTPNAKHTVLNAEFEVAGDHSSVAFSRQLLGGAELVVRSARGSSEAVVDFASLYPFTTVGAKYLKSFDREDHQGKPQPRLPDSWFMRTEMGWPIVCLVPEMAPTQNGDRPVVRVGSVYRSRVEAVDLKQILGEMGYGQGRKGANDLMQAIDGRSSFDAKLPLHVRRAERTMAPAAVRSIQPAKTGDKIAERQECLGRMSIHDHA